MEAEPDEINLEGHIDASGIEYIGIAKRQPNGKYHVLAKVNGNLCRVECGIRQSTPTEMNRIMHDAELAHRLYSMVPPEPTETDASVMDRAGVDYELGTNMLRVMRVLPRVITDRWLHDSRTKPYAPDAKAMNRMMETHYSSGMRRQSEAYDELIENHGIPKA